MICKKLFVPLTGFRSAFREMWESIIAREQTMRSVSDDDDDRHADD